jgi:hypothetical protein
VSVIDESLLLELEMPKDTEIVFFTWGDTHFKGNYREFELICNQRQLSIKLFPVPERYLGDCDVLLSLENMNRFEFKIVSEGDQLTNSPVSRGETDEDTYGAMDYEEALFGPEFKEACDWYDQHKKDGLVDAKTNPDESNDVLIFGKFSVNPDFSSSFEQLPKAFTMMDLQVAANLPEQKFTWSSAMPEFVMPSYSPRLNQEQLRVLDAEVKELVQAGIYEPAVSVYGSPWLCIPKAKGGYRSVVALRRINTYMCPTVDHVRSPEHIFLQISPKLQIFSELDFKSAFLQIKLQRADGMKCAAVTRDGTYVPLRLPMRARDSQTILERLIRDHVVQVLRDPFASQFNAFLVEIFRDNLFLGNENTHDHKLLLEATAEVLSALNLKVGPGTLGLKEIPMLGFQLGADGIRPMKALLDKIHTYPTPVNPKEVKKILGLTGFYRSLVPFYSDIS